MDYPGCSFVTIAMDKVEFRQSVREGSILRIDAQKSRAGNTSVQYTVTVFSGDLKTGSQEAILYTNITFVCVDERGQKKSLPLAGS
ncbi:MAG TPA: acyl-CoA thioesterase [Thermodesulfovibrionales bacterium]|nr:acyl-CoA thioesterase [Thermodesulfovibrionales bacterium]